MAGSNRGLSATKGQRDIIIDLVSQLEAANPTPAPNYDLDKLCGTWRLMFTTAFDVLSLGAIPLVQSGEIFQNVRAADQDSPSQLVVDNVVNLQPAADAVLGALGGGSTLELVVTASGTIVDQDRVDIAFLSSRFQPKTLLGQVSAPLFRSCCFAALAVALAVMVADLALRWWRWRGKAVNVLPPAAQRPSCLFSATICFLTTPQPRWKLSRRFSLQGLLKH